MLNQIQNGTYLLSTGNGLLLTAALSVTHKHRAGCSFFFRFSVYLVSATDLKQTKSALLYLEQIQRQKTSQNKRQASQGSCWE